MPIRRAIVCAIFCSVVPHVPLAAQCEVEGVVPMTGAPAPLKPSSHYQIRAGSIASAPSPLAVVFLEGSFKPAPPGQAVVLGQKGYQFAQSVLPVQSGTSIVFPNFDDDYHNVFSYSRAKRFDLGRYRKDETPPALHFDRAGVVRIYCEIHEHMRGVVLVLDTPHFTVTATDGKYRLQGLPEGNYSLKAWLDEKTVLQQAVSLRSGRVLRVDFAAAVAAR